MALFKIFKGNSSNLQSRTPVEGFCWFTPDNGKFYIDTSTSASEAIIGTNRIPLNAYKADILSHTPNNTTTFLRGDNSWSNTITGSIILGSDDSTTQRALTIKSDDGRVVLYSKAGTNNNWVGGLWAYGNIKAGGKDIITIANDINLTANFAGNATTATKFNTAQSIALTGDVTGTASSQAGWNITTTLANSGATAGNYGPSNAVTGNNGTTMNVPYITVDTKGRVTSISNKVYTAVNTWRGIQDNLTSSSNTTESLSAKQGYLLANGSARDSTKVLKAGDTMTGALIVRYNSEDDSTYVATNNTYVGSTTAYLMVGASGNHGIRSNGYWHDNAFTSSAKWLLYRNTDGNTVIPGTLLTNTLQISQALTHNTYNYSRYHRINYQNNGNQIGILDYDCGNAATVTKGQFLFYEYSPNTTNNASTTGHYEYYYLPQVATGLTSDTGYAILTSKTAVTVAQGGTGATTAAGAFNNLASGLTEGTATTITDDTMLASTNTSGATNDWYLRSGLTLYNYIQAKADNRYLKLSGGTLTDRLTAPGITINSTTGAAHLQFSRESYNYIIVPFANNGHLSLANSVSASDIYYDFTDTAFSPGATNTYTLGTSSKKWDNVYATTFTGDLTGNAASSTYAANIRITNTTPTSATYYPLVFTTGVNSGTNYVARGNQTLRVWLPSNGSGTSFFVAGNTSTNGGLCLYSSSGKYVNIVTSAMSSANRTLTLPDKTGTAALTNGVVNTSGGRNLFVVTSASVPSGAVAGDIVLVKV